MKKYIYTHLFVLFCFMSLAQTKKLHRNISNGLDDEMAPKISADGNAMAFLYKPNRGGAWEIYYARKKSGKWGRAEELPGVNKQVQLLQLGGFNLNEDGSTLYFSSNKYGGVGGYDLWETSRVNNLEWTSPTNLYKPINSSGNECSPSISSDGNFMYFTRCSSSNVTGSDCCEIFVSKRRGKSWGEPKALPSPINKGCENYPFIHPDGKTLYFASSRAGGMGRFDLYMSKKEQGGTWSNPLALFFLNTELDDKFISMDAREHVVYYGLKKEETYDLYATIVEGKYRADPLLKIRLRLMDESGERVDGFLRIKHPGSQVDLVVRKINDSDYQTNIYLSGKGDYDFTIYGTNDDQFFFSEEFNLDSLERYKYVKRQIILAHIQKGKEYPLHLNFSRDSVLSAFSKEELHRLKKTILMHSDKKFTLKIESRFFDTVKAKEGFVFDTLENNRTQTDLVQRDGVSIEEERLQRGKINNIKSYCNQIGLIKKRMRVEVYQQKEGGESNYSVLIE
jgi:OOP family OmpA-OmpF porin